MSFNSIFQDVRRAVDWVHIQGDLKKRTVEVNFILNFGKIRLIYKSFVIPEPRLLCQKRSSPSYGFGSYTRIGS